MNSMLIEGPMATINTMLVKYLAISGFWLVGVGGLFGILLLVHPFPRNKRVELTLLVVGGVMVVLGGLLLCFLYYGWFFDHKHS